MRIGIVWNTQLPNSNYRALIPASALGRRGHQIVVMRKGAKLDARPFLGCHLVHFTRRTDAAAQNLMSALRRTGAAISVDVDDDLENLPEASPHYKTAGGERGRRLFLESVRVAKAADLLTTPSPRLAERYRENGVEHVAVIPNALARQWLRAKRAPHQGLVIGWTAGLTHAADDAALGIGEVLARVLDRHPEVRVHTIGHRLAISSPRCSNTVLVPFDKLPDAVATFDLGIAPLADIPFNRARSDIKVKEYAALGTPWLASPVEPYAALGEREGGRLVPDGQWEAALDELIGDAAARTRLSRFAQAWARQWTSDSTAGDWETALQSAAKRGWRRS